MADVERLHFKIGIAGTYWDKRPRYGIMVNDQVIKIDDITAESGVTEYIEFDADIEEGPCQLKIKLVNKEQTDTVENEDKTAILKDLLLNVRSVEIDEIDLANLIYTRSKFVADDADRETLELCIDLGWNGTWVLSFESPFYIWLLENI
jgi:hypothetical protein